jgi:hypothetical protein
MRIIVACEFSSVVRDAFRARGHDAVSCDLLPSELARTAHSGRRPRHLRQWMGPADRAPAVHVPRQQRAKHLCLGCRRENGAHGDRWANLGHAAAFFLAMLAAPIPRTAVENPIMLGHVRRLFDVSAPSQTIQPWQFGHPETKATCLWLKGLPRLTPTAIVVGRGAGAPASRRGRSVGGTGAGPIPASPRQWRTSGAVRDVTELYGFTRQERPPTRWANCR